MDAEQIRRLEPLLADYLKRFDDCFARRDTRAHLPVYIRGQLSGLPRKSVEPIALAADVRVRTLQEFLAQSSWDEDRARSRVSEIVAQEHACHRALQNQPLGGGIGQPASYSLDLLRFASRGCGF